MKDTNNNNNLNCVKTVQSPGIHGTTSLTITEQSENELSVQVERLISNQPNYIKKLCKQVLEGNPCNAMIIHNYIVAEEAEINIQELNS